MPANPLSGVFTAALQCGAALLGPPTRRQTLLILIFHRVLPEPDPLLPEEPDVESFRVQMEIVRAVCSVLPLEEAIERLFKKSLPRNAACITFDDGYANTLQHAVPVMESIGLTATVFVAAGFLGGGQMWNDTILDSVRRAGNELDLSRIGLGRFEIPNTAARRGVSQSLVESLKYLEPDDRARKVLQIAETVGLESPSEVMLSPEQVRSLVRRGFHIGAHTINHPILTRIDLASARHEIVASRGILEDVSGSRIRLFAYPNGHPARDYGLKHVEIVKHAGFLAAVSSAWGVGRPTSDPFQLPRLRPWEPTIMRFAGRLLYSRWAGPEERAA